MPPTTPKTKVLVLFLVLVVVLAIGSVLLAQSSRYASSSIPCSKYGTKMKTGEQQTPGTPCAYPAPGPTSTKKECHESTYGEATLGNNNACQEPPRPAAYRAGQYMTGVAAVCLVLLACCVVLRRRRGRKSEQGFPKDAAPEAAAPGAGSSPATVLEVPGGNGGQVADGVQATPRASQRKRILTVSNGLIVFALVFYFTYVGEKWNWASILGTLVALAGAILMIFKPEYREELGPWIVATGLIVGAVGFSEDKWNWVSILGTLVALGGGRLDDIQTRIL